MRGYVARDASSRGITYVLQPGDGERRLPSPHWSGSACRTRRPPGKLAIFLLTNHCRKLIAEELYPGAVRREISILRSGSARRLISSPSVSCAGFHSGTAVSSLRPARMLLRHTLTARLVAGCPSSEFMTVSPPAQALLARWRRRRRGAQRCWRRPGQGCVRRHRCGVRHILWGSETRLRTLSWDFTGRGMKIQRCA